MCYSGFNPDAHSPEEIITFNEKSEQFEAINCEVVVCSVDSQYTHLAWIKQGKEKKLFEVMKIILLSDAKHEISKNYGVYRSKWGYSIR